MITGNKKEFVDIDDLLYFTSGGREIYELYLGKKLTPTFITKRPWGEDKHPSFGVFYHASEDIWLWKDQATEETGNPITFVMRLLDLSYADAIARIVSDFELHNNRAVKERSYIKQEQEEKKYKHMTAVTKPFGPMHHRFWNKAEVSEDWCKKFNCYAVKDVIINRKKMPLPKDEVVFVYEASDINKLKFYFPYRRDIRFRTNAPGDYLWEAHRTVKCDKLVIHKSMKDLIVFSMIYPHNVATQNESIKQFTSQMIEKINNLSGEPWLFYGSDLDGVNKCREVTTQNGWKYINTPSWMLPDINDVYGLTAKLGLKTLEQYSKYKKLI